jgi:hypothetical protein
MQQIQWSYIDRDICGEKIIRQKEEKFDFKTTMLIGISISIFLYVLLTVI